MSLVFTRFVRILVIITLLYINAVGVHGLVSEEYEDVGRGWWRFMILGSIVGASWMVW
jgi:hypothetical protein